MSTPKRHHFVPEAYLTRFAEADSGFLNIYSARSGFWRRQKPKQAMVRNKYYHQHWAPDGVDKNILEKKLGQKLEPKGLASLTKLVTDPESLTDDDSANILTYIDFQRIRVPRQADSARELARTAITRYLMKYDQGQDALRHNRVVMNDSFRFDFMRMFIGSLTPYMARMVWEVLEADEDTSFITSDSPVSFHNVDFPPPTEAGIALYGTTVLFPIDSRHMLVMYYPEYLREEMRASDKLPRELEVEDGTIEIRRGTVLGCEAVRHHNWLIFQLSQDLIAGSTKSALDEAVEKVTSGH